MPKDFHVTALFLDIGGVLLTNGWDRHMRSRAAEVFGLDYKEMDERHHLAYSIHECGKLTLDEYLDRAVFYTERTFSKKEFKAFMFEQSKPHPDMIDLIRKLKGRYHLRIIAVSNEGRELTVYRAGQFGLQDFVDAFVSSCFVHLRKPDKEIYRIALDIIQVRPAQVLYIDDRAIFVETAQDLGIPGIHHKGYKHTRSALEALGLSLAGQEKGIQEAQFSPL